MILYILIIIFIISPFLPATENPHWFFRTPDFVRLQTLTIEFLLLGLFLWLEEDWTVFSWILLGCLVAVIVYQAFKVFPYSAMYPRRRPSGPSDGMVSIFAANVLQTNTNFQKFKDEISHYDPDLVLTMESNEDWEQGLSEIEKTYPYSVEIPLENYYGMHLYAKKELIDPSVNYHIEEDVPSIYFEYQLNNEQTVFFACLHPAPPSPTENETSKERDAELMLVGKHIREIDKPTVVCGDMNDVVWSRVTRLFKRMTGMIDPRVGRGFYATYHAGYRFMRFPLDHLFHTKDLYVDVMERSQYFGSDHFGMYYEIHLKKKVQTPPNPKLNGDEKEAIEEFIEDGKDTKL
ncbi:MAG: endonuclease/exonuclease/phosphatase family protein [Flavobacteriales bacterium]|nr:endonuclease/exonuclease/phosphatase family protein [Flavobacteriales bacterium]